MGLFVIRFSHYGRVVAKVGKVVKLLSSLRLVKDLGCEFIL